MVVIGLLANIELSTLGMKEIMMKEERISEAEVKRERRNLRETGLGLDPGLGRGDEIDHGLEIEEETGAEGRETDLPGETGVPENTDQILHKGLVLSLDQM